MKINSTTDLRQVTPSAGPVTPVTGMRVPMNRLDPEKLLELLVTVSKAIYQKPKYLRW